MKNLIQLTAIAAILSLASCSTIEDPQPQADLSVKQVNIELDIRDNTSESTTGFYEKIDMNSDGTVDFILLGYRGTLPGQEGLGSMTFVRLMPTTANNQVISAAMESIQVCNMDIEYYPADVATGEAFVSSDESSWNRESMLYVHMVTPADCSHHVKHFNNNETCTIGVRFMNNGYMFYGYVKLSAEDLTDAGCPELAEKWTLHEYGYNKVPEQGILVQ